jgi:hypothetical protein
LAPRAAVRVDLPGAPSKVDPDPNVAIFLVDVADRTCGVSVGDEDGDRNRPNHHPSGVPPFDSQPRR